MAALIVRWAALCCLCAALGGCAAVGFTVAAQVLSGALACAGEGDTICAGPDIGGAAAVRVDYPSAAVYQGFLNVAEADGRRIVARDEAAQSLTVSYPFSLLANNWGGEIAIHCTADGQGTRVVFEHGRHDAAARVRKIEQKMLDDALAWLGQPAGREYLDAPPDEAGRQD